MNLQGDLRDFSLADLLRILDHGRRTGLLTVETPILHGELTWRDGQLQQATLGVLQGAEAVYPWLIWPEGSFSFAEAAVGDGGTAPVTAAELIAEGLMRREAWRRMNELAPGWGPDSLVSWIGEPDPRLALPAPGASASDLIMRSGGATVGLAQVLAELLDAGRLTLEPTQAGVLHRWFQRVSTELYGSFSAISGFKLIGELDRHLQAAIEAQQWHLAWSGGKITDKIPFARTAEEQVATYAAFLRELTGFIIPIYGQTLVRQAAERAGEPTGDLAQTLKRRWLSPEGSAAETDESSC